MVREQHWEMMPPPGWSKGPPTRTSASLPQSVPTWGNVGQLLTISLSAPPRLVDFLHLHKSLNQDRLAAAASLSPAPEPALPPFPAPSPMPPTPMTPINTSLAAPQLTQDDDAFAREPSGLHLTSPMRVGYSHTMLGRAQELYPRLQMPWQRASRPSARSPMCGRHVHETACAASCICQMSVEVMKAEHCVSACMHGGNGSAQKQHRSPHNLQ